MYQWLGLVSDWEKFNNFNIKLLCSLKLLINSLIRTNNIYCTYIPKCMGHSIIALVLSISFQEIVKVVSSAGFALQELSKEQPSDDIINLKTNEFLKSLEVTEV